MKRWYESKTVWFNILAGIVAIAEALSADGLLPVGASAYLLPIITAGNVLLRLVTEKPIQAPKINGPRLGSLGAGCVMLGLAGCSVGYGGPQDITLDLINAPEGQGVRTISSQFYGARVRTVDEGGLPSVELGISHQVVTWVPLKDKSQDTPDVNITFGVDTSAEGTPLIDAEVIQSIQIGQLLNEEVDDATTTGEVLEE